MTRPRPPRPQPDDETCHPAETRRLRRELKERLEHLQGIFDRKYARYHGVYPDGRPYDPDDVGT